MIVLKQYKRALMDYYIAKYSRSGNYKELNPNKTYLIVNHPWFNYYHWMLESIPRIVRFKDTLKELTLILPQSIYSIPFVHESLRLFQFKDIEINDDGWHYHVPQGIISPLPAYCYSYDAFLIQKTRDLYRKYFYKKDPVEPFRKVYVSRLNASRRKFINEEEVIALMKKYNFEIIELENTSLEEQVNLFVETKYLVSMHGAALTNLLFMSPQTRVLEMYRKKYSSFELKSKVYKNLAPILGIQHSEFACDPVDKKEDFFNADLIANVIELERQIKDE